MVFCTTLGWRLWKTCGSRRRGNFVTFSLEVGSFRSKKSDLGWSTSQTSPKNLPWTPMRIYERWWFQSAYVWVINGQWCRASQSLSFGCVFFLKPSASQIRAHLPRCTAHPATTRASGTLDRGPWWPLALVVCCLCYKLGNSTPKLPGNFFWNLEEVFSIWKHVRLAKSKLWGSILRNIQ